MAVCCGKTGFAILDSSDILTLTNWEMTKNFNVQTFNTRSGSGWQQTCVGHKAITGTMTGKVDCAESIQEIADTEALVALELHHDGGAVGSGAGTGNYWSGNARISELSFTVNLESSEPQEWTCSFESDGSWTYND